MHYLLCVHLLLVAATTCSDTSNLSSQPPITIQPASGKRVSAIPLRTVENILRGTTTVVSGVGDVIAVGTGGTIRFVGDAVRAAGNGLDTLSDAVAGDHPGIGRGAQKKQDDASQATRKLISRPFSLAAMAVRSAGDATNMIGDTAEKLASEVIGILPVRQCGSNPGRAQPPPKLTPCHAARTL